MNILVSGQFVVKGRVGGAEHMLYNLVRGLIANGSRISLLCSDVSGIDPDFLNEILSSITLVMPRTPYRSKRFLAEQLLALHPSARGDAIIFPNYYTPPILPARVGRVLTVLHDLQYRAFPEFNTRSRYCWLKMAHNWTFARADRVVVITEFVRREVARYYGDRAARNCVVIPNPISWERFGHTQKCPPFNGKPYILAVAAHYPHKNLAVLIRALSIVRRALDARLVLVGQFTDALFGTKSDLPHLGALIEAQGLSQHATVTGYIDDATVGWYYEHASVFAFPSLYEGFGMPVVEAMGFGVPTVTTRRAALPEVTLGEAIYVDEPNDEQKWADILLAILDKPRRLSTTTQHRIRITYSPARVASLYLKQCGAD
jgi:glycosyltransferase involved in cell wall biosynthesis